MSLACFFPERDCYAHIRLIPDCKCALITLVSIFHVESSCGTYIKDDSDNINCALLDHDFDPFETCKAESITLNPFITCTFLNNCALVEGDTEVVLDRCVSFVRKFDLAACKGVNFFLLKSLTKFLSLLSKASCLD